MQNLKKYFYKSQADFVRDDSPLVLVVKSRQTGFSFAGSFRMVLLVSAADARLDGYISSIGWRYTGFSSHAPLQDQVFLPDEVWVDRLSNPFNFWRGLSPLRPASLAATSDHAAARIGFEMGIPFNELNRVLDLGFKSLPHGDHPYLPGNLQQVSPGQPPEPSVGPAKRETSLTG
jgi:hypothetical protein